MHKNSKLNRVVFAIGWILTSILFSGGAFAGPLDTLLPGEWYEAPNTNMSAINPCPANNCSYSGIEGQAAVMDDWSGGAYDTTRDRLIVWGGGHAGYAGNELYTFNIATMTWALATSPSTITSGDPAPPNTTAYYADGKPSSRHTYDYLVYVPNIGSTVIDSFFSMMGGGTYGGSGDFSYDVDSFSFVTNQWKSTWPDVDGNYGQIGTVAEYDPVSKVIWVHPTASSALNRFDPTLASGNVTVYPVHIYLEIGGTAAIDTKRHKMMVIGSDGAGRQVYVWDLNNPANAPTSPATTGDAGGKALESANGPGFAYDPVSDKYVGWNGGTSVYLLDPNTWVWSKATLAATNTVAASKLTANTRGTYGRFTYIPSKNVFAVVNYTNQNVFFYKLSSASGSLAPTVSLTASAGSVASGGSVTLTWSSTNATGCTASGAWSGSKATSGNQTLTNLLTAGTYTLSCSGAGGSASQSVAVTIAALQPTITLTASPTTITSGQTSTLSWTTSNATSCTASGAWSGTKGTMGSETTSALSANATYTLSCSGAGGSASQQVTVTVSGSVAVPTVTLSSSPSVVTSGGSVTLTWSSTNASGCAASGGWTGSKSSSGSETLSNLTATTTYTLACTGAGGTGSQSTTVTVSAGGAATALTTVKVTNTGGTAQTNGLVTFGQYFKSGHVPATHTVTAKDSLGNTVELQVDKKATHADTSLKHAVLTAKLPNLAANSSQMLTLYAQPPSVGAGTAATLSQLLGTTFDAQVNLNVGGTVYSASAKTLLTAGTGVKTWLSGPLVSEWIVGGAVKNGTTSHAHLAAYFHVRAYGNPITRARVDVVVENNWTFKSGAGLIAYVPSVTVGGSTVYNNGGASLNHYHHSRWHKIGWWGGDPALVAYPDGQYLRASGAVPNYATLTLDASVFDVYIQTNTPMSNANLRVNWGQTGYDRQIGLMPEWAAAYVISGDARAYNAILANDSAAGSYGYHYRDENTGYPPSIDTYPTLSEQGPSGGLVLGTGGNAYSHEPSADPAAHQPLVGYMAYVLTGDYYYLEEVQFLGNYNMVWKEVNSRKWTSNTGSFGLVGLQNRGQAWGLRTLSHAAAITPDDHPLRNYFIAKTNNNITAYTTDHTVVGGPDYNVLGAVQDFDWNYQAKYSPWQNDFFVAVYGRLVELGFTSATTMRNWLAKWPVGRMGGNNNESGYCWKYATKYDFTSGVVQSTGAFNTSFAQLYAENYPTESQTACPTSGQMDAGAYPSEATSYYSNMRPAMAIAVDAGVATMALWNKFAAAAGTANYATAPIWAVVPRDNGNPAPVVTLLANPNSVAPGGSTTITWSSINATGCTASGGWSGAKALSGSQSFTNLNASATYSLSCTGAGGSSSQSVTVTVVAPLPTVTFSANVTSVPYNGSSTLTWSTTNATSCTGSGAWSGTKATSGSQSLTNLTTGGTYTLSCTGSGGSASQSVTLVVAAAPPTSTFSASSTSVAYNGASTLTWSSTNATSCTASGAWTGSKATSGSQSLTNLTATGTYTLACSGSGGSVSKSVTINVAAAPAPTLTLSASSLSVAYNGSTTLSWSSTNATTCTASGAWTGTKATSGSEARSNLTSSGTFTLVCTGAGGSATQSVLVNVAPSVTLTASPASIAYNGSSVLTWSSQNATDCTGSNAWSGTKATSGSQNTGSLTTTSTYVITCTGAGGSASANATVTVAPQAGMPTVTLSANPTSVASGGTTTLTWSSTNSTTCTASGAWSGTKATSGSATSAALTAASNLFTLTCANASGTTAAQTVTVTVPATVTLSASSTSVAYNGSTTLTWSSTNAASCTASGAWSGAKTTSGSQVFNNLTSSATYTLACGGVSKSVMVNVAAPPLPTVTLSASPTMVALNGSTTLNWSSTNATSCTASALPTSSSWTGVKAVSGTQALSGLTASTTYTLSCTGAGGSAAQTVSVGVTSEPPTVTLSSSATSVAYDGSITLTWSSENSALCTASGLWSGTKAVGDTEVVASLTSSGTFTLTCIGPGGTTNMSVDVTVAAPPVPEITFTATANVVASNGTVDLEWDSIGTQSCIASGKWSGEKPTKGKYKTDPITSAAPYTLTCTGPGGKIEKTVVILLQKEDPTLGDSNNAAEKKKVGGGGSVDPLALVALMILCIAIGARRKHA